MDPEPCQPRRGEACLRFYEWVRELYEVSPSEFKQRYVKVFPVGFLFLRYEHKTKQGMSDAFLRAYGQCIKADWIARVTDDYLDYKYRCTKGDKSLIRPSDEK